MSTQQIGTEPNKTEIAFVFDDGFPHTSVRVAEIFESFGWRAIFAVLAEPESMAPDLSDFPLWRELSARGHFIHPHGLTHANLTQLSFESAVAELTACFARFEAEGFPICETVYHFAYNQGTPELIEWLLPHVRAVRIGGSGFNSKNDILRRVWHCTASGPDYCDQHLLQTLHQVRTERPPLFIYNLHGIDEAWGPISEDGLKRALEFVAATPGFSMMNGFDFDG